VLKIDVKDVPELQTKGWGVYNGLHDNASTFTAPNPTLAVLLGLLQALDTAQQRKGGGTSATKDRDLKARAVYEALESERGMVQTLVNNSPEQAEYLAKLAGMEIAGVGDHVKEIIKITPQGTGTGNVKAEAHLALLKAGRGKAKKTQVNWRATADGGKTYFQQHSTPVAHTTFTGLALNVEHGFEVSITDSAGTTDWSQTIKYTPR
jgi:hypothetical protein